MSKPGKIKVARDVAPVQEIVVPLGGAASVPATGGVNPLEMFGADGLSLRDLPRITIPAGGGKLWDVGGAGVAEIKALLVYTHAVRTLWASREMVQGELPLCSSVNGFTGQVSEDGDGDPRVAAVTCECGTCPLARKGTEKTFYGDQKASPHSSACRTAQALYLIVEGRSLPFLLRLPRTSVNSGRLTLFDLAISTEHRPWLRWLHVGLDAAVNAGGQSYSVATLRIGDATPEALHRNAESFAALLRGAAQAATYEDVADGAAG